MREGVRLKTKLDEMYIMCDMCYIMLCVMLL